VSRSPRRARRGTRLALAAALALPWLSPLVTPAGADAIPVTLVRRWAAIDADANVKSSRIALDPSARTAYVLSQGTSGTLAIRPWDLDRLTPRGPAHEVPGFPALTPALPVAVDERGHSLLLAPRAAAAEAPRVTFLRYGVPTRVVTAASRFPAGYAIVGMSVDAARGLLLTLAEPSAGGNAQEVGAGAGGVQLDAWRLDGLADTGRPVSPWSEPVRVPQTCGQVITTTFAAGVLLSADGRTAFFGCVTNRKAVTSLGPNAGDMGGVAELDVAAARAGSPTALRLRSAPGNFSTGDSMVVPRQRRLVLTANSTTVTNFKVFDTTHRHYVGSVGMNDIGVYGSGVNPVTGRGYYLTSEGFGVYDPAATPATQGAMYDDLSPLLGALPRTLEVDPRTSRVFAITSDDLVNGTQPFVAVLHDRTPVVPPDTYTPERGAVDAPEVDGVTDSTRSAEAAAVGAEYRFVGGPNNAAVNTVHFDPGAVASKSGSRWADFGVTRGVRLTGTEATAEALPIRTDAALDADTQQHLSVAPRTCSDFGGTPKTDEAGGAVAACDLAKETARGEASYAVPRTYVGAAPAPVQLGAASSSVTLTRAARRGALTSTLTAEATGVDILGTVRIGRVTATAVATAHGRPGTAKVTYTRSVAGVVVNGTTVCAADCPLDQVAAAVNTALGGRALVEFPERDAYAARNGAYARLADAPYRHVERVLFDEVADDAFLLPAMEVTVYADGTTASRHVVSLAALSTQATYRIYRLGTFGLPFVPPPHGTAPVPRAAVRAPATAPVTVTASAPATAPGGPVVAQRAGGNDGGGGLLGAIANGLHVAWRSPRQVLGVALMWSLLAVPVYLAARRRLLLDLPRLRRNLEEA
jgi:hypothetical protein